MTLSDITTKITMLTGADTTAGGFANADRLISINNYYNRVETNILRSQDEWDFDDSNNTTTFPILTTSTVANQADYALPSNAFKIKRVEISYDATTWYKAEPLDLGQYSRDTSAATINSIYQQSEPFYDPQYNSVFLFPVPTVAVSSGLKIWISRQVTEFTLSDLTTGTASPGFDANFHMILAYGPAYEFAVANNKENVVGLKKELEQLMAELSMYYGDKEKDRVFSLQSNYVKYD